MHVAKHNSIVGESIDTGKVLDGEGFSEACKQCELHEHLNKNSEEYRRWIADHNTCKANMETESVDHIFCGTA